MAELFWKQNAISLSVSNTTHSYVQGKTLCQLFVFMSVFKKKEMAIDHLFRAISLFCCGVSIALSMNKHVPKAPKKKGYL